MIEYALVSGQSFIAIIGPILDPLQKFYGKAGLSLSVAEAGFATFVLAGLIIVSLYFLAVKR